MVKRSFIASPTCPHEDGKTFPIIGVAFKDQSADWFIFHLIFGDHQQIPAWIWTVPSKGFQWSETKYKMSS